MGGERLQEKPTAQLPASPTSVLLGQCPPPCPQQGLAQKRPTKCAKPKPQNSRAWKGFSTEEPVGSQSHISSNFSSRHARILLSGEFLVSSNLRLISSNCADWGCSSAFSQGCLALWQMGSGGWNESTEAQTNRIPKKALTSMKHPEASWRK